MIHFGNKTLRVVRKRDDEAEQLPVLVVETEEQRRAVSRRTPHLN
jgi:hypothetical protein